jgi:hypothetical protein
MAQHRTISATMIQRAAERTGATLTAVRRVTLGLPSQSGDDEKIIRALIEEGVDRRFLTELHGALGGTKGNRRPPGPGPLAGWRGGR